MPQRKWKRSHREHALTDNMCDLLPELYVRDDPESDPDSDQDINQELRRRNLIEQDFLLQYPFEHQLMKDASSQIRLLRLHPAEPNEDYMGHDIGRVHCTSQVYDLDSGVAYVAISYTWGSNVLEEVIYVDSCPLRVPSSCARALRDVQHSEIGLQHLYWIDSVCINQKDHREKGLQVQQMSRVYSQAGFVLIYIQLTGNKEMMQTKPWLQLKLAPFFQRLWTVQECILAKRLMLLCRYNDYWISLKEDANNEFRDISLMAGRSGHQGLGVSRRHQDPHWKLVSLFGDSPSDDSPPTRPSSPFTDFADDVGSATQTFRALPDVVIRYSHRKCYDPRDKIYGLLSLIPFQVRERMIVDYGKSMLQVILDYTSLHSEIAVVQDLRSLDSRPRTAIPGNLNTRVFQSIQYLLRQFLDTTAFLEELKLTCLQCAQRRYSPGIIAGFSSAFSNTSVNIDMCNYRYMVIGSDSIWPPKAADWYNNLTDPKDDTKRENERVDHAMVPTLREWCHFLSKNSSDVPYAQLMTTNCCLYDSARRCQHSRPSQSCTWLIPRNTRSGDLLVHLGQAHFIVCRRSQKSVTTYTLVGLAKLTQPGDPMCTCCSCFEGGSFLALSQFDMVAIAALVDFEHPKVDMDSLRLLIIVACNASHEKKAWRT